MDIWTANQYKTCGFYLSSLKLTNINYIPINLVIHTEAIICQEAVSIRILVDFKFKNFENESKLEMVINHEITANKQIKLLI